MHDTPEQIAARLTKAQKRVVILLPPTGRATRYIDVPAKRVAARMSELVAKGAKYDEPGAYRLTTLGAAVRAVVAKEDGDA